MGFSSFSPFTKTNTPNSNLTRIEDVNCCCIKILSGLRCVIFICFFLIGSDQKQVCADTGLRKYSCSYWRAHTTKQIYRRKAQQSAQRIYTKVKRQCCMFLSQIISMLVCSFIMIFVRGVVVSSSVHLSQSLSHGRGYCVVYLCNRCVTLTVPLSTQLCKWVPVNLMLGVYL